MVERSRFAPPHFDSDFQGLAPRSDVIERSGRLNARWQGHTPAVAALRRKEPCAGGLHKCRCPLATEES